NQQSGPLNGLASVTDYLGYYRFNNIISSRTYLFVPQKPGCTFVPREREYVLPDEDRLQQNYVVSCIESFGIEGHVKDFFGNPVEGVTLTMAPDDVTALTDEDGYYSKDGLSTDTAVEVTPSKTRCVFSPASRTVYAAVGGVSDVDFVVHCGNSYSVSGRVADGETPIPGFKIVADGGCCPASSFRYTDDEGRYEFSGLRDGFDYVIRPELIAFATDPESIVIEGLDRDYFEQDFALVTTEMVTFSVTGTVRDNLGNPLEGLEVAVGFVFPRSGEAAGMHVSEPDTGSILQSTDEEGRFSFPLPRSWSAKFFVNKAGCYFIPDMRWCKGDRDYEDQDFVAHCGGGAAISGYVCDIFGRPAPHVRLDVKGEGYYPPPFDRTDSTGYYEFTNLPNGLELTVRPEVDYSIPYEGCILCPSERVYYDVVKDLTNQNFTISCPSLPGGEPAPLCNIRPDPN
ncbi:MAG: carboxypeptidase regulatory-like domain-containing protein, partial [bacterium]